ncbi:MAG: FAD-binding oxidoreductase [Deinococcus sp.]|nr:FAD-binding oxidoreductase [Deinococcus sp.]
MPKAGAVVVGAGVPGASVAYQLAKRGLKVMVLEKVVQPGLAAPARQPGVTAPSSQLKST